MTAEGSLSQGCEPRGSASRGRSTIGTTGEASAAPRSRHGGRRQARGRRRAGWIVAAGCVAGAGFVAAAEDDEGGSIGDAFEVGGHVELAYERQQNFDLDRGGKDDLDLLPLEFQLELLFAPNAYFQAYFQPQLTQQVAVHEQGDHDVHHTEFAIEQAYVMLSQPERGLALQVGRQSFEDQRQWLYDAELDAVRGSYRTASYAIELSASREALVDKDLLNPDTVESANNYILYGAYAPSADVTVGAYGILRDGGGDRPVFLGLQSFGSIGGRLTWWLDGALVRGHTEDGDLRGYGIDLLGTYEFDAPLSPHVILGYAFGSGDGDPDDDRDGGFRQTGLQGNETEVGGLTPFSYYGEALDPELSTLSIVTLGLGARPTEALSADLVYHIYRQDHAAASLRDAALDAEPNGRSRRLGSELDLVLGFEEEGHFRLRGFLGWFMPGRAFDAGADAALFARIEAEYEF